MIVNDDVRLQIVSLLMIVIDYDCHGNFTVQDSLTIVAYDQHNNFIVQATELSCRRRLQSSKYVYRTGHRLMQDNRVLY
jgi:hypothetical protein